MWMNCFNNFFTGCFQFAGNNSFGNPQNRGARIDGFNIIGASQGGGIVVNGYAGWMNIGNNRMEANAGFFGGGRLRQ